MDLSNNHGPVVNIAAWFSLVVAVLATACKLYTKFTMIKALDWTDITITAALLMSVGMVVATASQVDYGLGRDETTLSNSQINQFFLTTYVASLFYVLAVFTTKISTLHFYLCLTRKNQALRVIQGSIIAMALWIIVSIFVQSFQCSMPNTWLVQRQTGTCIEENAFWIVNGVIDFLSQLLVGFLPLYLLHDINTSTKRKWFVRLSFTPNLITLPFIILRMIYLPNLYSSSNATEKSWTLFLISVVHANAAILAATLPFTKPILDSLSVGAITNDVQHGLAWDHNSYIAYAHGNKSVSSGHGTGGTASRIFMGWRKSFSNGASESRSRNGSAAGPMRGDEMNKIRRTVDLTVESVETAHV